MAQIKAYEFRVTAPHTPENSDWLNKWCHKNSVGDYMIAEETGGETNKPHYQGLVFFDRAPNLLGQALHGKFGKGNENAKVSKVKNLDSYISYLAKDYVAYCTFDFSSYPKWDYKQGKKAVKQTTFSHQIVSDFGSRVLPPDQVYEWVYWYFAEHTKISDDFIIKRFAQLILAKSCKDYATVYVKQKAAHFLEEYTYGLKSFSSIEQCHSKCQSQVGERRGPVGVSLPDDHVEILDKEGHVRVVLGSSLLSDEFLV